MTEYSEKWIREQARFEGIFDRGLYKNGTFAKKIPLSSVKVHAECREYVNQALDAGLDGTQIQMAENELSRYMGCKQAVLVSSGAAALCLALKLAAEKLYGSSAGIHTPGGPGNGGALQGKKVFCPDLTSANVVNPVAFEGGEPVLIDATDEGFGWSMSAEALELAFQKYPDVKIVILDHVYGFPADAVSICEICLERGALLIECAGEAFGAEYLVSQDHSEDRSEEHSEKQLEEHSEDHADGGVWRKAGSLGDYCVLDFGRGGMLGSSGGAILVRSRYEAEKAKYWASGARAQTPWNQHEELGHDCLLGELDAAVLRGGLAHIDETIAKKQKVYETYVEMLEGSLAAIIPVGEGTRPNYWMTCMTSESSVQFMEVRNDRNYLYRDIHGTAAPMEIYDALRAFGAECGTVYKPMSMQPVYQNHEHFTLDGSWRMYEGFYQDGFAARCDLARAYYESGIVLPSDADMTAKEQGKVIEIVCACFNREKFERRAWA